MEEVMEVGREGGREGGGRGRTHGGSAARTGFNTYGLYLVRYIVKLSGY